jgi:hypothetical protein
LSEPGLIGRPPLNCPLPPGWRRTPGDENLTLTATVSLLAGQPAVLDPASQGMQLLVDQPGAPPVPFLRLTDRPGRSDSSGRARHGLRPQGRLENKGYTNTSGALPPACAPGSARGIRSIKLEDRRTKGKGIGVTVKVSGATLPLPTAPLRVTIVFGASAEAGGAGRSGRHQVSCTEKKGKVTCR